MNAYAEEVHELEKFRISTKQLLAICYTGYENEDLNKVVKN